MKTRYKIITIIAISLIGFLFVPFYATHTYCDLFDPENGECMRISGVGIGEHAFYPPTFVFDDELNCEKVCPDEVIVTERTHEKIYNDFIASQKRSDHTMKLWGEAVFHSDADLIKSIHIFESELELQNNLYNEYSNLPHSDNIDESIYQKFKDIENFGIFPNQSFIDSLKFQKESERDITITLEYNGCENTCPIYSVMINGDGSVLYKGFQNVKNIGKQEYEIPVDDLTKLNPFLFELTHQKFQNEYGLQDDNTSTIIITVEYGHPIRIVNHSDSGPELLKRFEEKIIEISMIGQFIKSNI